MARFLQRLRALWNNEDAVEMADEEARRERQEDYDVRKDHVAGNRVFPGAGGRFDFEQDSEPPRP